MRDTMASVEWQCVSKDYIISKNELNGLLTLEHPLKQSTVTVMERKGSRLKLSDSNSNSRTSSTLSLIDPLGFDGTDPLSQFVRQKQELSDPLSQMENFTRCSKSQDLSDVSTLKWNSKRLDILNHFTTSQKLSISTSFLTEVSGSSQEIDHSNLSDKMKHRLEQLDDFEDGSVRHMTNLSQQEYISRIEQLSNELVQCWNGDQRVKALKIAIQCSKTLSDTSVLHFYPSQFVLITDVLDIFGKLVYERLKIKADTDAGKKSTSEMVRENARETCQNWFFKIASIRELLPRLYVEMALLKCYSFLTPCEFGEAFKRITHMIRGIGDPLIAIYARCYLVHTGLSITSESDYIRENFNDFLSLYHVIFSESIRSELHRQHIDVTNYLELYGPALDWILQALVSKSDTLPEDVLNSCKDIKNNGPLLISTLNSFKPEYIALSATQFVNIFSNSVTEGITEGKLLCALGKRISNCPTTTEKQHVLLKSAIATINKLTNIFEYINCIEAWAQFIAKHFSITEINNLLGEIKDRISQNKIFEKHYPQLLGVIDKILNNFEEFDKLLISSNFLPFMDIFQKESIKIEVSKSIMMVYKNNSEAPTSDPVVTNTLMYICKILNDSVTTMTVNDARRQIGNLISHFVRNVDYENDFEQQLIFYGEARAIFFNLDGVIETLVYLVNKLAVKARRIVSGTHTNKLGGFVRACVAYSLITIPSISSVLIQMNLYLLSGQVAISNCCLEQADTCFEKALKLVESLPRTIEIEGKLRSSENYLISYLCNTLSILVVVPDSPEQGVLYLIRLLLDVVKKFPFELHSTASTIIYLRTLDALYVQTLNTFPYSIPNVVSNDELYGSDPKFIAEVNSICSHTVEQILNQLKVFGLTNQLRAQGSLALDLFLCLIRYADVRKEILFQLAISLWNLAVKHEDSVEQKAFVNALKTTQDIEMLTKTENYQRSQRLTAIVSIMKKKEQVDK